ncbi:glycogenin-1 isoform X3 [Cloeon dipterum]|uniref:glycogenin-1 isoform X3 n=1 Tax=Cloeon dipterum TaxID=197152 RepID=UPI00321FDC4E
MAESSQAWVTLATNDSYSLGALVLAHSLKRVGSTRRLVVMVTSGVTMVMQDQLRAIFDEVHLVDVLDSKDAVNLALLSRPDLGITFTKLHCWRLTNYNKCVFLDADTLVLQPCDELFDREEFSAAPDPGWPDCFNSGVFVFRPNEDTYKSLISLALTKGSFDGGDQGLLNTYFNDWATRDINRHLPFIYNMCSPSHYSYLPAFKQFGEGVKIAHFIGPNKPWSQFFDSETKTVRPSPTAGHLKYLFQFWWDLFCAHVHPHLSPDMPGQSLNSDQPVVENSQEPSEAGLASAFSQMKLGEPSPAATMELQEHLRRSAWEQGSMDFMGADAFENIWSKIMDTVNKGPSNK